MQSSIFGAKATRLGVCFTLVILLLLFGVLPVLAQKNGGSAVRSPESKAQAATIPAGTILPVVLRTAFSFDNCKPGLTLTGKIAQDVSLPNGSRMKKGSMMLRAPWQCKNAIRENDVPWRAGIKASATGGRTGPSRLRVNMKPVVL